MVVNDFDIVRLSILPSETDSPLVIDADAVLAGAVADQRFETIPQRDSQILKFLRRMQVHQLAPGCPFDGAEPPHRPVVKQIARIPAAE
jgi:hypothetical protein